MNLDELIGAYEAGEPLAELAAGSGLKPDRIVQLADVARYGRQGVGVDEIARRLGVTRRAISRRRRELRDAGVVCTLPAPACPICGGPTSMRGVQRCRRCRSHPPAKPRKCEQCGTPFVPSSPAFHSARFHSAECWYKWKREHPLAAAGLARDERTGRLRAAPAS